VTTGLRVSQRFPRGEAMSAHNKTTGRPADWRTGRPADWRTGRSADWR
jgi:hypothetical protein